MYLPKSKYEVEYVGPGKFTKDGKTYTGPVLKTYLGETYAGTTPWNLQGKVEPVYKGIYKSIKVVPGRRIPTEDEYEKGSMTRYFRQDTRTGKVVELLPEDWGEQKENYTYASASWVLTGSLDDTLISGRWTYPGVRNRNQKTIDYLETVVPGIFSSQVLCDPEQFVRE